MSGAGARDPLVEALRGREPGEVRLALGIARGMAERTGLPEFVDAARRLEAAIAELGIREQ